MTRGGALAAVTCYLKKGQSENEEKKNLLGVNRARSLITDEDIDDIASGGLRRRSDNDTLAMVSDGVLRELIVELSDGALL